MTDIKSYVIHPTKKNRTLDIIDFDDHIYSSGRRGFKASYRDNYAGELKTFSRDNGTGFKPSHSVAWLQNKFFEGVGATDFPSDKQIKNKYSTLKQGFKEASEDI